MGKNIELNEQEQNRRDAVVKLRELGIEPYPAALYEVNVTGEMSVRGDFNSRQDDEPPYHGGCVIH